jgi:acetylglutamate kinase
MMKTIVVKYGGAAMNEPAAADVLASQLVSISGDGVRVVLIHGGGPEIDRMIKRVAIEPRKVQGLRVTDAPTMEIVEMVLAGKVNKGLVSRLSRYGAKSIGISGRDAGIIRAKRKISEGFDLGFVGTVEQVNNTALTSLLDAGFMPVICSVAEDADGAPLNINADEVAAAVAVSLKADILVLLTDVPGVLRAYPDPASRIERISATETEALLDSGVIDKGMIPKLRSCVEVVRSGVREAKIIDGRDPARLRTALTQGGLGTTITL